MIILCQTPTLFVWIAGNRKKRFIKNNVLNISADLLTKTCGVSRTRPKSRHKLSTGGEYESVKCFILSKVRILMKWILVFINPLIKSCNCKNFYYLFFVTVFKFSNFENIFSNFWDKNSWKECIIIEFIVRYSFLNTFEKASF